MQQDTKPAAGGTGAGCRIHGLAPGVALLVWKGKAGDRRGGQLAVRRPETAVIGPVPDDPLLMRCRIGQIAADPAGVAVEMIYLLDRNRPQRREIVSVLRSVHAAYDVPARLLLVTDAGRAASALNVGAAVSHAPILVWLDDAVLPETPAWLSTLTRPLERDGTVGIVAARLLREDGTLWNNGVDLGYCGMGLGGKHRVWDIHSGCAEVPCPSAPAPARKSVTAVSPDCIAVARSVLQRCGGFSSRYRTSSYGIADLCLSAAVAGYKVCLTSEATLFRLPLSAGTACGGGAADPERERDRCLLERRWRDRLRAVVPAHPGRAA